MHSHKANKGQTGNPKKIYLLLGGIVGGYYLWGWHKDHVLQYWPIAIFLMCPLMHLFHGHGSHAKSNENQSLQDRDEKD